MRIGVLALQGDFLEHRKVLEGLGVEAVEVRLPEHLDGLQGLILPGGESTAIGKLMVEYGLLEPIRARARAGFPLWGTCAGMILMAREAVDALPGQPVLGVMDIVVRRNAFGRQVDSFEADLEVPALGPEPVRAVFIRAPWIEAWGPEVEVLARLEDGTAVAARQGHLLATAFHPELTDDPRFHAYFLELARRAAAAPGRA